MVRKLYDKSLQKIIQRTCQIINFSHAQMSASMTDLDIAGKLTHILFFLAPWNVPMIFQFVQCFEGPCKKVVKLIYPLSGQKKHCMMYIIHNSGYI